MDTIGTLIALATQRNWKFYQLDVKSIFLNGVLQEEVYMDQPKGYVKSRAKNKVYKLTKALYGLNQALRAWNDEINSYLLSCGFHRSASEATLHVKFKNDELLIMSIYVDDIIYTGNSVELIKEFKNKMMTKYEITDIGPLSFFWNGNRSN